MDSTKKTTCPNCNHRFTISDKYRTHQIGKKYTLFWFFDAINQFEHFNEVRCPSCGHQYRANEARLLFFFKSPYTLVLVCTLLAALMIIFVLKLK